MAESEHKISRSHDLPTIYADRITNISFGPLVCKLFLANEIEKDSYNENTIVAIPTPALIDAVNFIALTLSTNDELKAQLIQTLKQITEVIEKNGSPKAK